FHRDGRDRVVRCVWNRSGSCAAASRTGAAATTAPATRISTAAAAAPTTAARADSAADPAVGCTDRALSRSSIGTGADGIDLSARSDAGGTLGRKEPESQGLGARGRHATATVGSKRQGTDVGTAGAGDDE